MTEGGNCVECRADAAGVGGFDYDDEFSLWVATVDLRAGECLDCAPNHLEALGSRLHKNAGDLNCGRRPIIVRTHPSAVHEFSAVDTAQHGRFGHDAPHFDGGPGGPLIA